ncbi:MAG: hypothetical protein ACFB14_13930 [Leptolyngbyaceae cyanobacterium]
MTDQPINRTILDRINQHGGLTSLKMPGNLPPKPPWERTLRKLTNPGHLFDPAWATEPTGYNLLMYCHRLWMLDAFITQKWDKTRKPSLELPHGFKRAYKPFGELYKWVATSCEHGFGWVVLDGVTDATEWFAQVVAERTIEGFGVEASKKGGKKRSLTGFRKQTQIIRSSKNPLDRQRYPYTWHLIEIMNHMGKKDPWFNKQVRANFLKARSSLATELESEKWAALKSDDGTWVIKLPGKGRAIRKLDDVNLSPLKCFL